MVFLWIRLIHYHDGITNETLDYVTWFVDMVAALGSSIIKLVIHMTNHKQFTSRYKSTLFLDKFVYILKRFIINVF